MTKDGRFFETKGAAELNEAEESLVNHYDDISIDISQKENKPTPLAEDFIKIVNRLLNPLDRYIKAVLGNNTSGKREAHEQSQSEEHERSSSKTKRNKRLHPPTDLGGIDN